MFAAEAVTADTDLLPAYVPLPGLGLVPTNAFLIRAAEPVLVDAGVVAVADDFMRVLRSRIAVEDIRWLWLTHTDADHIGAVDAVLAEAPQAKVVTTYLGLGKMGLRRALPPERIYLLNPGQALDVGDRQLVAIRPPTFDAPETTALFDSRTKTLFSADSFGALLPSTYAEARAIPEKQLKDGVISWATIDAPWLPLVAADAFGATLKAVSDLAPASVLSSHLPPASGELLAALLGYLDAARLAPRFVGPDQAALMQSMAAE